MNLDSPPGVSTELSNLPDTSLDTTSMAAPHGLPPTPWHDRLRANPQTTRKLMKTAHAIQIGERVKAAWKGCEYKGCLYPGILTAINADGTFHIDFDDGDEDTACPAKCITRDNGEMVSGALSRASKSARKRKKLLKNETYMWRHDGIVRSHFAAAAADGSFAKRLIFDYEVSYKIRGTYTLQDKTQSISLHEMVTGEMTNEEKNMHVAALSEFMKELLLTTPTEKDMTDLLESSQVDPMGPMNAAAHAARTEIYANFDGPHEADVSNDEQED